VLELSCLPDDTEFLVLLCLLELFDELQEQLKFPCPSWSVKRTEITRAPATEGRLLIIEGMLGRACQIRLSMSQKDILTPALSGIAANCLGVTGGLPK
jgi:hypothetical protein